MGGFSVVVLTLNNLFPREISLSPTLYAFSLPAKNISVFPHFYRRTRISAVSTELLQCFVSRSFFAANLLWRLNCTMFHPHWGSVQQNISGYSGLFLLLPHLNSIHRLNSIHNIVSIAYNTSALLRYALQNLVLHPPLGMVLPTASPSAHPRQQKSQNTSIHNSHLNYHDTAAGLAYS